MADAPASKAYKWLSALLCYPEQELLDALPQLRQSLDDLPCLAPQRQALQLFLEHMQSRSLRQLQEAYVATFDRGNRHALYLFEHVHGEDRERGAAMVDLLEEYRRHGFELGDDELPDYLPALLEFFSQIPPEDAQRLLGEAVHVIAHIANQLHAGMSPYAALLDAVVSLSAVPPQPLTVPPVRDMDEAMDMFGPDEAGMEPLLTPGAENIVKFYPRSSASAAAIRQGEAR